MRSHGMKKSRRVPYVVRLLLSVHLLHNCIVHFDVASVLPSTNRPRRSDPNHASVSVVKAWQLPASSWCCSRPYAMSFKTRQHPETLLARRRRHAQIYYDHRIWLPQSSSSPTRDARSSFSTSRLWSIRLPRFPPDGDSSSNDSKKTSSSSSSLSGGVTGRKKISSRYDATRQGGKKLEKDVVDASDGGGGGFLRGWFSKKDDDEDSRGEKRASSPSPNDGRMGRTLRSNEKKEDSVFRKVQSVFSKPEGDEASVSAKSTQQASKPAKATTTDSKKKVDEENIFMKVFPKADNKMGEEVKQDRPTSEDSNPFARFQALQGIFARNATSDDAKPKEPNATNLNPLSSLSKLLALDRFGPIEQWITVFPKTRIMPGQIVPVTVAGLDLLVIASRDGRRLYCIVNSCSHLGTPLETGTLVRLPRVAAASGSASTSSASPQGTLPPPSAALVGGATTAASSFTERDISNLLSQDGCEDCIVCPLHRTAFALESGDVRGEWCPYPPVLGSLMATAKKPVGIATFDVRTRGKFVQVRINTPLPQTKDGG